ncbi:diguanylate cyclase domain-containing protein [Undibacterium sp. SXout11W]|uniref:GGDEF domain-containing protein n=1 Tax=Undibacterium sp. SXout11W TaxID=3413050 RepID=UPI003BF00852
MKEPELPVNEQQRLAVLRALKVLDTPPEERFDRVTRMARRIFGVPIALVSLVDENRQWFKSCDGLIATETDRNISFCGHAILQQGTFVIQDAHKDPRFFDNPLVTGEPYVRFYAGHPLTTLTGESLGTLCIIDHEPREFGTEDTEMLADRAGIVERELTAIKLSLIDEITRISNRRGFLVLSHYSLEVCKRQSFPTSLVFFDLDKFKEINDTYGHAEGDRALKVFADQMRDSFRNSDIFARMGGDEFVALLTNIKMVNIRDLIQRFEKSLHERCVHLALPYTVRFSCGIIAYDPERHVNVEELMQEADKAMYANKASKR